MISYNISYWKRLWHWTTSQTATTNEIEKIFTKEVIKGLKDGLVSYKGKEPKDFSNLQSKYADQTKLLSVVQTLQNYMDINCFEIWEIIKHYLCDVSYGTPASALKNVAFIDTRSTFLSPKVWHFYYAERLFLLKLLQYIVQFKSDKNHKYYQQFRKIFDEIGKVNLTTSLIKQFEKLLSDAPPPRKIQTEFGSDSVRQEWAESNVREQLAILQTLLLISQEEVFSKEQFTNLLKLFRKHGFGKNQSYLELLEERHREACLRITYLEVCIFMVVCDHNTIENVSSWLETTKDAVEIELTKLELSQEHSAMLMTWMMLTLKSNEHVKLFETQYQHYGVTALRLKIFEFLQEMLNCSVFSDNSKYAAIARNRIFQLLNNLCDKFDGDGTLSMQPGIMQLCSDLLRSPEISEEFWKLRQKDDDFGVVSLWNTALEYFPYNFNSLSILSDGLAQAGNISITNLLAELKDLPVYTEIYNPNAVPIMSFQGDNAIVGRDYYPLGNTSYHIEAGSTATIMERKEGTMVHFRTPYSYWTIFNNEIEKVLDRKQHHQYNINVTLERVYGGTKVLKGVLQYMAEDNEVPKNLVGPSEGVFDVLLTFMRAEEPPLPILVECINVCTSLVKLFPKEIHLRLINTGLLPRIMKHQLSHVEYANGASFDSAAVGSYLVIIEQPSGSYKFLAAYIDMLCAFYKKSSDERITLEIILPGLVFVLREVFPNICAWRYINTAERRSLLHRCINFLTAILEHSRNSSKTNLLLKCTCVYSFLYMENALELLKIVSVGNEQLERTLQDETNWISGSGSQYLTSLLKCIAIIMFILKQKNTVTEANEVTPLEKLIFAQNKQKDLLKVVPKITSYINHAFNKNLSVLSCRLLKIFANSFQMSLFSSLDMTAYQVRVMFLDRLRDKYETVELKEAILEFVATCISTQPGLTEAFFMMNQEKIKAEEKDKKEEDNEKKDSDETFEGILGYMGEYLGLVKADAQLLHNPILAGIMSLFHALWKNNMQILIKKLRENKRFWEYMASPLFNKIQPGLRTYGQIFNILSIELFVSRGKVEDNLKEMLQMFFDTNKNINHLEKWIGFIFSFQDKNDDDKVIDKVPVWLSLLTSWKDFVTIFCKYLPLSLNIAHKAKMVAPCMSALLSELEELRDCRLVVILAELYVIMLANWKDDCFDNRKASAKQIDNLLIHTANVYESLHPRAIRAILSIGTVAISSLDYEIKANSVTAQNIIRSVTNINSIELDKLFNNVNEKAEYVQDALAKEEVPPVVLSLAMLEQCLDLYDDMFSDLPQWFQSTKFINKLLCCLQACLQNRRHYFTSLAALRCLTAYARGPFNKDLLHSDVDQFLWMHLLPPKLENESQWKPQEWWRVYAYSLDFISMMVMKHGQFFMSDSITFVGVHLEHLIEAILLPRQVYNMESLNLCASTLNLVVQLVKYETTWRLQNINSLVGIMRSISACVYQCVTQMLRTRRASDTNPQPADDTQIAHTQAMLHRTLEILHMATLCLLAFSPDLLSLLANPGLDLERWQPLVELHFGAPKISYEPFPQLTFGTIMSAICLLTRSLNHAYHGDEGSGSRSPRSRRRTCSCSPGERRAARADSVTSASSAASALPHLDERLAAGALEAATALLASQALLAVRDRSVPSRHKQLVRRELASELTVFHDFVRKRILCAAHTRPHLVRNKLGAWPLPPDEEEVRRIEEMRKERNLGDEDDGSFPPPPPPKRASNDSMREYILRKHYLDKCAKSFTKDPPLPMSHSTPTSDKKKEASRSSKRVSWADTTRDSGHSLDNSLQEAEQTYSNLTDVQINNEEDYFHFMSVVFLYICQTDL